MPQLLDVPSQWLTKASRAYLGVFLAGLPLGILGNSLYPGVAIIKGQALAVVAPLTCGAVGFILWLFYRPSYKPTILAQGFLVVLAVVWLIVWVLEVRDDQAHNYATFLVPLLCLLLIIKPVGVKDATLAGLILAWTTIGVSLIWQVQQMAASEMESDAVFQIHLPVFSDPLGRGERWQGPFENPNYAGPAAAFALIFSLSQRGWNRTILFALSVVLMLATGSRSALLGAIAGGAVYLVTRKGRTPSRFSPWLRIGGISTALALVGVLSVFADPTLNGRTLIWPIYFDWWLTAPWTGVGTSTISGALDSGLVPGSFIHAHNVWIDVLARYGIALLLLTLILTGLALTAGLKAASFGRGLPLALGTTFVVIGLVEVHGSWAYWGIPGAWLVISVMSETGQRRSSVSLQE